MATNPIQVPASIRTDEPVTVERVVAATRQLLVTSGTEAITMRNVAAKLSVGASALYKHVRGREEILDRLTATCLDELTTAVANARDHEASDEHHSRLLAAGFAFHNWATTHPAEFALAFATPATVRRPTDGLGYLAGRRLEQEFLRIIEGAARAGRLRPEIKYEIPTEVLPHLHAFRDRNALTLDDRQLWTAVRGFHDLLGLIMVETMGQLGFVIPAQQSSPYVRHRLSHLAASLIAP